MSIPYFIYVILYISITVVIFGISAVMLHRRTRVIFKAPVPHIHDIIGKTLIPWGMTYVIFLPDIYLTLADVSTEWRNYEYAIVTMLTCVISLATTTYAYLAYLQQPIKEHNLMTMIILLPLMVTVWYMVSPSPWVIDAFYYTFIAEVVFFIICYVRLYKAFVRGIENTYSSVDEKMFQGIKTQWMMSAVTMCVFFLSAKYDTVFWNITNILTNALCISLYIYTSEHLMPLPEKADESSEEPSHDDTDMAAALLTHCEETLLFCNSDLSLSNLAMAVGTNRTYLSKWFTDNDTTFYNYINSLRVKHAEKLLRTTKNPVAKIQTEAGFVSSTTFRKYFLSEYGCSPSEYRKRMLSD